jgi:predicted secreted protein
MKWTSGLAIYFVVWWTVLFAVLPLRVRNAHEAGESVAEGHDAGAPVAHALFWKAKVTTAVASVVFAVVYAAMAYGGLDALSEMLLPNIKL